MGRQKFISPPPTNRYALGDNARRRCALGVLGGSAMRRAIARILAAVLGTAAIVVSSVGIASAASPGGETGQSVVWLGSDT
ncbi:MAG: hypothetical protein DLM56_09320 [Pseudonocardiales bacterium]|nr:MAG: hypothetical protein DLM56_09320 [Pseudonocardiales bacterium]